MKNVNFGFDGKGRYEYDNNGKKVYTPPHTQWDDDFLQRFGASGADYIENLLHAEYERTYQDCSKRFRVREQALLAHQQAETIAEILPHLYQIWAMIPLTQGMNAREEIKKLIDTLSKEQGNLKTR